MFRKFLTTLVIASTLSGTSLNAASLLTDGNGSFGEIALAPNDDGFSSIQTLPFSIDFFGQAFNSFYINNNGNITFGSPLSSFTPFNLGTLGQAMIAPYWADVDTRCSACGNVYVGGTSDMLSVTWDKVGYYPANPSKLNSFQLNLYKVGTTGDFDIEFRYDQLEWTTGDASDGVNGLGGVPAVAGYTNGDQVAYLQPGSFLSPGALNMAQESNVSPEEPGRWVYNIRNDTPPPVQGETPENPILPTGGSAEEGYDFSFDVDEDRVYFIDPPVATGYDFSVAGGPLFTSAIFTTLTGDTDGYELYALDGTLLGNIGIGQVFNFSTPIAAFLLRGIAPSSQVDPADPLAFVSGFTFNGLGSVTVTQTPEIGNFTPTSVPEPATWAMMLLGLGFIGASLRRRRVLAVNFA